jgi:primosomal protein N' (replication factor Y)
VLLPLPFANVYDYVVPDGLALAPGDCVHVPLGPRRVSGIVWGDGAGDVAADKLRSVAARIDLPSWSDATRAFLSWVANYTLTPLGAVLRLALSVPAALEPPQARTGYTLAAAVAGRRTAARQRVAGVLADGVARAAADLAREAKVSGGVVRSMADAGLLRPVLLTSAEPPPLLSGTSVNFSPAQASAAQALRAQVKARAFSVTVLDGVTGSGKTEVYLDAVAEALQHGQQALVLVPEIALTAQWLERFRARFGAAPSEWHSELSQATRRNTWRAVAEGRAQVVVGARSALFLPFADLGLIVVDEEHDGSYKQEDGVIYNARDMAVARGHIGGLPVVLVSATPSLETVVNVDAGRYGSIHLPERHGAAQLPTVTAVDMRAVPPARGQWLSPVVIDAVNAALAEGSQAMLFLNRRGYAPLTLCRTCGHRLQCPSCQAWLVEHRYVGRLACHHCGHAVDMPKACPSCAAVDSLAACGPGVERIAEEVATQFPQARRAVMASDTVAGPAAAAAMVRAMAEHRVDILIGTQIVAKGHHFPLLTVVAVVDADLGLGGGDLRASERTFQLLSQVAGRAGRAERAGHVYLQTYLPEHPVIEALLRGDRAGFLAREADDRRAGAWPPFGRLVALIVSGHDVRRVESHAQALARAAPRHDGVRVLGPAPAPLALLRGRHRYRLLLRAERSVSVQTVVREWLARAPAPNGVRLQVDVDPYSFF